MEYSNLFGTSTSSGGGSTNLSNYYNKQEVDAIAVQKANLSAGKLASGEVPDLAITNVVTVANNTARDALTVEAGDVAIVSSTGLTYMYTGSAWTQIESTQVSWDNVLSSSSQTATAKFSALDTALGNALTPLGSTGNYKIPLYLSSQTSWTDFPQLSNTGSTGQSIIAWDGVGTANGGQIQAGRQSTHYGSSASNYQGRYMVKKVAGDGIIDVVTETQNANESQLLRVKLVGSASDDGQYLKYNHSSGTASWQAVSSGSGPSLPSIAAGQANEVLRVNGSGNDLETFALVLSDAASVSGQVSLKGTTHSKSVHSLRTLKSGSSNVTISTPNDPNCIEIAVTASGGGSSGPTINDSQTTSTSEVWSSDYTAQQVAGRAALSHNHDDRYYTESEVDTFLAAKAAASHNHDDRYYTESEVDTFLAAKAAASHNHDDRYYTESEVDTFLAAKAPASHNHDSVYIKIADRKSAVSSTSTDVYDAGYLNTQLAARMSNTITDMGSSGTLLHQVTNNTLGLKRLAASGTVSLSEANGIVTISGASGGGGTTITNGSTSLPHVVWSASSGGSWVPGKVSLEDIVPSANIGNGKVLKYDSSTSSVTWQDDAQGSSATLTSLLPSGGSNGQILKYNGTSMYWATDATGSGGDGVVTAMQLLSTGEFRLTTTVGSSTTVYTEQISTDKIHWKVYANTAAMPTAGSANHGMVVHNHAEGAMYYSHNNAWVKLALATDVATNATNIAAAQTTISGHTTSIGTNANAITANANAITANTNSITANTNAITPLQTKTTDITYGSSTTSVANTLAPEKMNMQTSTLAVASAADGDMWSTTPSSTKLLHVNSDLKLYKALTHEYHRGDYGTLSSTSQQQAHMYSNYNNSGGGVPFTTNYHKSGQNNAITLQVNQSGNTDNNDKYQYEIKSVDEGSLLKVGKLTLTDSDVEVVGQAKVESIKFPNNTVMTTFNDLANITKGTYASGSGKHPFSYVDILGDLYLTLGSTSQPSLLSMQSDRPTGAISEIVSKGKSSAGNSSEYSSIETVVDSNTAGSEYVHYDFIPTQAGNMQNSVFRIGKASSSDTDARCVGTFETGELKFTNGAGTQAYPVTAPGTAGHVLTAAANGTWLWSAPAGASSSGPTIIYVDTQATGASGVTAITDTNAESNTNKYGAFWGRRGRSWTIKDEFSARPERDIAGPLFMNGQRGTGSLTTGDYHFNYIHRMYGHIDFIPQGPYRYNFTRFYIDARAGYAIASNHEFRILASNDGATWEILKTFTLNSMTTDSSRTNSNHGIVGSDGNASMYYTSWTNTNYYSLWRIQHSDIGSGSNMVTHATKYLINMDYTMNEIEWG